MKQTIGGKMAEGRTGKRGQRRVAMFKLSNPEKQR